MSDKNAGMDRRTFLRISGLLTAGALLSPADLFGGEATAITRAIPSSGERIPVIGMGTSRTFDVGSSSAAREGLREVLQTFFDRGGAVIDSSPMYGAAEAVTGDLLRKVTGKKDLFAATKVWTDGREEGIEQMKTSMGLLGVDNMDLMQIHNLRDWKVHLPTLRKWKEEGRIRYIGITTSHGRYHDELARIIAVEPLDFVQFSYNIGNRSTEERLLPLARERGVATLINRPFQRGDLFGKVKGRSLPEWAADYDITSWAQFFLKFIVATPGVTCIIPATSKVHHMRDNMAAGFGRVPDQSARRRMLTFFEAL